MDFVSPCNWFHPGPTCSFCGLIFRQKSHPMLTRNHNGTTVGSTRPRYRERSIRFRRNWRHLSESMDHQLVGSWWKWGCHRPLGGGWAGLSPRTGCDHVYPPPHLYITAISVTGPILENGKSRNPPESYRGRIENDDHQIGYDHH